jgi:plasmid maintenance system antidote protein VapI
MVRLKAVLMILQRRFAEPDFSAQKLAFEAGLSERYVNELLTASAASATWRLSADSTTSPTSIAASAGVSA